MHIVHLSTPTSWRGGEQQIAYLVDELHQKGIQQTVICPENSVLYNFCKKNNFKIQSFKGESKFIQAKFLAKWCQTNKPTLIHLHDAHAHTVAVLSAIFFGNKVDFVLSRRVDFPVKKNFLSKYKYNHKAVKKIVCVSHEIKRITAPAIEDKSKLVVVHSGIDQQKFEVSIAQHALKKEFNIPLSYLLIGNVAALAPHKDYFTFLETAKHLLATKQDLHFLLIGKDDGTGTAIQEWLKAHRDIQKHFTLTGFRSDIPQLLPQLDVFLFTSKTEGLGTSVLDAFASGVPVVATAAGGIPESVIHEQTGLLAPVGNAPLLAQHVLKILDDQQLKKTLTKNAKVHLQQFTKAHMAQQTLAIYQDIHQNQY